MELREIVVQQSARSMRVKYQEGQTILEALRAANLTISSQCEQGYCGSCIFQLLDGEVMLRANNVLGEAELLEGLRLGCQAIPLSATLVIELF